MVLQLLKKKITKDQVAIKLKLDPFWRATCCTPITRDKVSDSGTHKSIDRMHVIGWLCLARSLERMQLRHISMVLVTHSENLRFSQL